MRFRYLGAEYLSIMGVQDEPEVWVEKFNTFDANGDGVITEDEVESSQ